MPSPISTPGSRPSTPSLSDVSVSSRREFEVPHKWKPSIMSAIRDQQLNWEVRCEITRDLVTHIYSYMENPKPFFVESVAKKLVDKYPFMCDHEDPPHVSCLKYC